MQIPFSPNTFSTYDSIRYGYMRYDVNQWNKVVRGMAMEGALHILSYKFAMFVWFISATGGRYFSLRTNQHHPSVDRQYFSLRINYPSVDRQHFSLRIN